MVLTATKAVQRGIWPAALLILIAAMTSGVAGEPASLLPDNVAVKGVKLSGAPIKAEGEELFHQIDGGAVLFLKHQFKNALFQEYVTDDGLMIVLELYRMAAPANAQAIYQIKKGDLTGSVDIGDEAVLADYYLFSRQGPYFVTVTGAEPSDRIRAVLMSLAQAVSRNIARQSAGK